MRPRLYSRSWLAPFSIFLVCSYLAAQEPYRVPFTCSEQDLEAAGVSCSDSEPCEIYLELSSIAADGRKLFAAGNLHTSSVTIHSVLLMSDDNGASWKEPSPRVRGAALDQVQFYNLQDGWVSGETQYPLPRDPFILLTTDAGESWRRVAIGEEGSPGYIQRFNFDNARHGELIVDAGKTSEGGRYLAYESETGGSSWTLRSKNDQQPKSRIASTDNSDWRARPSRDGKLYDVEARSGDKFNTIARFQIEVATCRSQPSAEKESEQPQK
jgi:photosystem II stability/assembly factor-like uncharacterized protein